MMVLAVNEDQVQPGVTAFLIVAALGVTLFFLIRSMNKRISRIQAPSEEDLRQAEWESRQKTQRTQAAATPEKAVSERTAEHAPEGGQREA